MKKVISLNALITGAILTVFALIEVQQNLNNTSYLSGSMSVSGNTWLEIALWIGLLGIALIVAGAVLLWVFRKKPGTEDTGSAVLVTAGWMQVVAVLVYAADLALSTFEYVWPAYSGTTIEIVGGAHMSMSTQVFGNTVSGYSWQLMLGFVLMAAGVLRWLWSRRKPVEPEPEPEPVPQEEPAQEKTEEKAEGKGGWVTLFCTVMDIRGDYALLRYDNTGVESEVAIALLPFGIDKGDRLKYENYEFTEI